MVKMQENSTLKLLDCTLRDGGYVNNFDFGKDNIRSIANKLSTTGVDLIELGFLKNGEHSPDQTLFNYVHEAEDLIGDVTSDQNFCLMIRPDWYDITKLQQCTGKIKFLRFAFHYSDIELTLEQASVAKSLGYEVFFNPVNVLSYTQQELKQLLRTLNAFKPRGIYVVDTFGSMLPSDLREVFSVFAKELDPDIALGLHLHENLSISLALAINFIEMLDNSRPAYIDCSIEGMGRIPGNLCTELIMGYLNMARGGSYDLKGVYQLIDNPISQIKKSIPWGYMPAYAITAFNRTHRSYAEYLLGKQDLSLQDIDTILNNIQSKNDREEFDKSIAERLYEEFLIGRK